jgi:hypothetical protein
VRFLYLNPDAPQSGDGGTVIREIQVFGSASQPTSPTSEFGPVDFQFTPAISEESGTVTFSVQISAAGTFVFQRSQTLSDWEELETRTITPSGLGPMLFTDPTPPTGRAFYRITKK